MNKQYPLTLTVWMLAVALIILPFSTIAQSSNVEVTFTNIRSAKGELAIGIFKDNKSFEEEIPYKSLKFSKTGMNNGTITVSFYLPPGTYGLSMLDDENLDGKMEYNFIGIPQEGFGFSDYWHTGLTKPDIEAFDFTVVNGAVKKINVKVKYIL